MVNSRCFGPNALQRSTKFDGEGGPHGTEIILALQGVVEPFPRSASQPRQLRFRA